MNSMNMERCAKEVSGRGMGLLLLPLPSETCAAAG